jgi:hypothetical protein
MIERIAALHRIRELVPRALTWFDAAARASLGRV